MPRWRVNIGVKKQLSQVSLSSSFLYAMELGLFGSLGLQKGGSFNTYTRRTGINWDYLSKLSHRVTILIKNKGMGSSNATLWLTGRKDFQVSSS